MRHIVYNIQYVYYFVITLLILVTTDHTPCKLKYVICVFNVCLTSANMSYTPTIYIGFMDFVLFTVSLAYMNATPTIYSLRVLFDLSTVSILKIEDLT